MTQPGPLTPSVLPVARNPQLRDATTSVSTYCRICEASCGLVAELDDGRLARVRPNSDHVHSRGFSCSKPQGLLELMYDPDRLTTPMIRTGGPGEFTPATWEEALDACAAGLSSVRDRHGAGSLAVLRGNPPFFDWAGLMWEAGFSGALGITSTYTVSSEDGAARLTANEALYGDALRLPLPDLWHTQLAMIIGANPLQSRSTRMSEPQTREAFDGVIARGGRVLVVDPRRTETAERYEHVSIRPGTDPWFLIAVCKVISQVDPDGRLSVRGGPVSGREDLAGLTSTFDLDDCAARCGVDRETLLDVGRAFADSESAIVYGATGTCAQRFGTLSNILQDTILALTGNVDRVGGLLRGWAAVDLTPPVPGPKSGTRRSRAEGRPEVAGSIPSAALAADILHDEEDRVRALVIHGNNSVLSSGGGGERLENALQQLDFSVAVDIYMNETNRFADVLLPVTTMFERADYPVTTSGMQLRPTAYATRAVIDPVGDVKDAWWIFDEMSRRMGLGGACPVPDLESAAQAGGRRPEPRDMVDALLSGGPADGLTFEELVTSHPNGVALRDSLPVGSLTANMPTPDGRVQLFSAQLRSEVERLRAYAEPDDVWPLRLIGRREKGSQNTWLHNSSRLYPDDYRFAAQVHPGDAADCGVEDGDQVRLVSAAGAIVVPVAIVDSVRRGVVSVPNGWGHAGGSWKRANELAGVNSNELVSPDDVEELAGMSILNGVAIRMERVAT